MPARTRWLAVGLGAVLALSTGHAGEEKRDPSNDKGILDDYNVEVYFAGDDVARVAVGATFGDVFGSGFYWSRGARASWLQVPGPSGDANGWALGALVAAGYRPEWRVSPFGFVALDKPFGVRGRYGLESTVGVGARLRVSAPLYEHYVIGFAVIRNDLYGSGAVPDRTDHGVAVFYATSVLIPK